ncbi:uncharacterized protein LOC143923719 [Lithobates pipiens]
MNGGIDWLFYLLCSTGAALQMTGPSTYEARVGSIAHIPCTFTADTLPADPRYFAVVWHFEGKRILSYDNIVIPTDPRYSLNIDGALNGIADLTISNTFLSDGGIYTCSVTNSPIQREKEIKVEISGGALQMTGPSTYEARVGSIAHIPCTFTADTLPADPRYFTVFWYLEGKHILNYDKTVTSTNPRYSLDKDRALHGIADLTILNTLLSDGGIYTCLVNYSSFLLDKKIRMNVSAQPRLFILGKSVQRNRENNLTCMASGFFPNNIHVTWYKDREVLKNQSMGEPLQYDNGTYQVNSTVTITPIDDDQNKTFSCRIQHVSLEEPLREDFHITYQESSSHVLMIIGIVIAVMVIIGIIAAVIWWGRKLCRKAKLPDPEIVEIMVPELMEGEPATLKCRIKNYVESLHRMEGYQMPEKKSVNTYNNLPVERDKTSDDQNTYIATLELQPVQMADGGSEYEFRVQFRGARVPIKKSTGPIQVKAKLPDPEIVEIMVPELMEGEPATLKCRIKNYVESLHRMEGYQMIKNNPVNTYNNLPVERDKTSDDQNTYIATLELQPVQMADDGPEYEFRVQFRGARVPIKKSTGPIQVKGKNQASLQEGKNCTKSHTAENNKPQSPDQQKTCKPENETLKESYEKQPECLVKKDNIDTDLAPDSSSAKLEPDDKAQSTNLDNMEEKNLKQNPPNSTYSEENVADLSKNMKKDYKEDPCLGSQTPNQEEIIKPISPIGIPSPKLEGGDTEEPTFLDNTDVKDLTQNSHNSSYAEEDL